VQALHTAFGNCYERIGLALASLLPQASEGLVISANLYRFLITDMNGLSHRLSAFSRLVSHGAFASALFSSQSSSRLEKILTLSSDPLIEVRDEFLVKQNSMCG
jgi:hypothetical protein